MKGFAVGEFTGTGKQSRSQIFSLFSGYHKINSKARGRAAYVPC